MKIIKVDVSKYVQFIVDGNLFNLLWMVIYSSSNVWSKNDEQSCWWDYNYFLDVVSAGVG